MNGIYVAGIQANVCPNGIFSVFTVWYLKCHDVQMFWLNHSFDNVVLHILTGNKAGSTSWARTPKDSGNVEKAHCCNQGRAVLVVFTFCKVDQM